MPTAQIGNIHGVAARTPSSQALSVVTSNGGASLFNVGTTGIQKLETGQAIDCYAPDGTVRFTNRLIELIILTTGLIQYMGGDVPAVTTGDLIYATGTRLNDGPPNFNGGVSMQRGFRLEFGASLDEIRARLQALSPTYYTEAFLNGQTYNDLLYALRLLDAPDSI